MHHDTELGRQDSGYVEKVYARLLWMVTTFRIRPSQPLNIVDLARLLNVSRTPVREALNRIFAEGLIEFRPNYGFFNRALTLTMTRDSYVFKKAIELAAADLIEVSDVPQTQLAMERAAEVLNMATDPGVSEEARLKLHELMMRIVIGAPHNRSLVIGYNLACLETRYIYSVLISNPSRRSLVESVLGELLDVTRWRGGHMRSVVERLTDMQVSNLEGLMSEGLMTMVDQS